MLCLFPGCAVSIASVIGLLREPIVSFVANITHRERGLNPRNRKHNGYVCRGFGLLALFFKTWQRTDSGGPRLSRSIPILQLRHELVALAQSADADGMDLRARLRAGRVDRRTAMWAK